MQPVKLDVHVESSHNGTPSVARLDGKLVLETVTEFLQTMRPQSSPSLVVDMSSVSFLDSAGVGALVQLFVHRRNQGQKFALAALYRPGNSGNASVGISETASHLRFCCGSVAAATVSRKPITTPTATKRALPTIATTAATFTSLGRGWSKALQCQGGATTAKEKSDDILSLQRNNDGFMSEARSIFKFRSVRFLKWRRPHSASNWTVHPSRSSPTPPLREATARLGATPNIRAVAD